MICDSANCYLFSVDDNGHVYRSTSSLSQFPNGFGDGGNTVVAASAPNKYDMFEATQSNPFLAASNTTFSGAPGRRTSAAGRRSAATTTNLLPWRIGLATQTNSTC